MFAVFLVPNDLRPPVQIHPFSCRNFNWAFRSFCSSSKRFFADISCQGDEEFIWDLANDDVGQLEHLAHHIKPENLIEI